jgi:thiol-disulfide isomerase/thioredoxin
MLNRSTARISFCTCLTVLAAFLPCPVPAVNPPVIRGVTGAGLKKAVQSYRGKVVVANIWATWCEPCVEEYPELVKLYRAYKSKDVVVVSISLDDPDDRAKVAEFVRKQEAPFPVLMRAPGSSGKLEAFINPLDRKWSGAAPTTYVFDRNGRRVGPVMTGERTYAQFEAAVKAALKQTAR